MGKFYSFLVLSALVIALRAEPAWKTNFEEAKTQAKKEGKALLLDFTGSDWCPACKLLREGVLTKPEFAKFAEKNLVLVEVDFPNDKKKQTSAVKKQNDKLSKKFSVDGFPTILLLSPEGKELGRVEGYEGETPDQYIKGLEKFLSKNEKKISASVKG